MDTLKNRLRFKKEKAIKKTTPVLPCFRLTPEGIVNLEQSQKQCFYIDITQHFKFTKIANFFFFQRLKTNINQKTIKLGPSSTIYIFPNSLLWFFKVLGSVSHKGIF